MELKLKIDLGNDAFVEDREGEIARIMRDIMHRMASGVVQGVIFDSNGNNCGEWEIEQ